MRMLLLPTFFRFPLRSLYLWEAFLPVIQIFFLCIPFRLCHLFPKDLRRPGTSPGVSLSLPPDAGLEIKLAPPKREAALAP